MPVSKYLAEIRKNVATKKATEHTHRAALEQLVESLAKGVDATNEPKREECGAPDYVVSRRTKHGPLTIGHIEAKDIGLPLGKIEKSDQIKRYLKLPNLILTDYLEFRWYVLGEKRLSARLATVDSKGKIKPDQEGNKQVLELLQGFLSQKPLDISKPKELAERLAFLAHMIRDIIIEAFAKNKASEMLADLRKAFAKQLIPDLDQPEHTAEFADMFAQTLAYGLFAACINHDKPTPFKRLGAAAEIPKTNPFLRRLFETITGTALDDEPFAGFVDDIVQLLAHTNIEAILANFGKRTKKEDPIVHFYETFLAAYDPKLRESRGVYYTPEPVVSYIVRSVDHLLKDRFNCPAGLADTAQIEYEESVDGKKKKHKTPKVLILDPACGTGTFLYTVVDHIRDQFMRQHNAGMWSGFVRKQLLRRLFGFELLMAPYAVAHLKLGMQLAGQDLPPPQRKKWTYDFSGKERLDIYLTNTLEEAEKRVQQEFGFLRVLAEEANGASVIKKDLPIMVVMGNPPYAGHSANRSEQIIHLAPGASYETVEFQGGKWERVQKTLSKKRHRTVASVPVKVKTFIGKLLLDYYLCDGDLLGERNTKWLQDDYVKFIRFGQWRIEQTGCGILALITNNSYLDNPTFRGMRQQLINSFADIYVLNLHGSAKKKEVCPDGSKDENVFDIQQGVSIALFVKESGKTAPAKVHHAEIWGLRGPVQKSGTKYHWLAHENLSSTSWEMLKPDRPHYLFVPQDVSLKKIYDAAYSMTRAMPVSVLGFQTHRDHFAIDFERKRLSERIAEMRSNITDDEFRDHYKLSDTGSWKLPQARRMLRQDKEWQAKIIRCLYRPLDWRPCYFSKVAVDRPRRQLLDHVTAKDNLVLGLGRQGLAVNDPIWYLVTCGRDPVDANVFRRGGVNLFPLYLYGAPDSLFESSHWPGGKNGRRPNLSPDFVEEFAAKLRLEFVSDGRGDLKKTFGPEDIFAYAYAVFHSPTYRTRYAEFLKIDFPRLPLTSSRQLFARLVELGQKLVDLHLLENIGPNLPSYPVSGDNEVEKVRYTPPAKKSKGQVWINKKQYFDGVAADVWDFHIGGYQVCEKWLKDRKGRKLTDEELPHYPKIVAALAETISIMNEIDKAIPEWPIK